MSPKHIHEDLFQLLTRTDLSYLEGLCIHAMITGKYKHAGGYLDRLIAAHNRRALKLITDVSIPISELLKWFPKGTPEWVIKDVQILTMWRTKYLVYRGGYRSHALRAMAVRYNSMEDLPKPETPV